MSSNPRDTRDASGATRSGAGDVTGFDTSSTGGGVYSTSDATGAATSMPTDMSAGRTTGTSYTGAGASTGQGADVGQAVSDVADQAKQAADQVKEKVTEQASTTLDDQKQRAAGGLLSLAQSLTDVSTQVADQNPTLAQFTNTTAERLNQWSRQLSDKDVGELLDDVERFARRNPALFVGGAFALGLLGARFLKSSAPTSTWAQQYRYQPGYASYDYTTGGRYPSYGTGLERQGYVPPVRDTRGYGTTYGSGRTDETPYMTDATTRGYTGTTGTTSGTRGTSGTTPGERTSYSPYTTETTDTTDLE